MDGSPGILPPENFWKLNRGVARNLLRGQKRGSGDGSHPAGSRGRAPVGSGGEAGDKCSF